MRGVKWLFVGRDGLRYGWRFLIFAAAIFLAVQFLEQPAIAFLTAKLHIAPNALSAPSIIVSGAFDLILILIVTGVVARFERRRIDSYGLPINQAFGGFFWNGAIAGCSKNWIARKIAAAKIRNRQPYRSPCRPTNNHLTPLMLAYTNFSLPNESTLGNFLNPAYFRMPMPRAGPRTQPPVRRRQRLGSGPANRSGLCKTG